MSTLADKLDYIQVGGVTTKDYSYDSCGRTTSVVTSAGTTTLAYDYESRITQITYPNSSTNTFTYNGLDTRVGKVDSAGTHTYRRDGVSVTAPVLSDGLATYTPGVSERRSGTTKHNLSDRMGTFNRQLATSQSTNATRTCDAFGMLVSTTGTPTSPFGFAGGHGYQEDADSGLKLLGHRYYDASTGRFLTRDPVRDGRNWYTYCENRPTIAYDADGLKIVIFSGYHGPNLPQYTDDEARQVREMIRKLEKGPLGQLIYELINSEEVVYIKPKTARPHGMYSSDGPSYDSGSNTIHFDPNESFTAPRGRNKKPIPFPAIVNLAHELGHADGRYVDPSGAIGSDIPSGKKDNILHVENPARRQFKQEERWFY